MTVLVVGGAGYIGSHAVDRLIEKDYDVAVVDSLVTGHQQAINPKARFYEGDLRDRTFLNSVFEQENIGSVMHFAAFSIVPESMSDPLKYFDNNIGGMLILLEVMRDHDVKKIIFSSTAAVYGQPEEVPIMEDVVKDPINPYGDSKLAMEKLMNWSQIAYGINYVALRYFNVAGAKADGSIGEDHHPETHLIPIVLDVAAGKRKKLCIFGDDYDTPDGTNVRDYVHVVDLVDAHIQALDYLDAGNESRAFNLGSSTGFSNQEILAAARRATGQTIPAEIGPRRPGDPDTLIAASQDARDLLHWRPAYDNIEKIIETAWIWEQKHPNGYEE